VASYPVHYEITHPLRFSRLQLLVRFAAFVVLGMLGLSFGSIFAFAFLALPVVAAVRLSAARESSEYVDTDGRWVIDGLRWLAAVSAWAGLIAEQLPSRSPDETLRLDIEPTRRPKTAGSALLRVITGLPSAFVLCILGWIGAFVWVWAALSILFRQRVGDRAFQYLVGLQRWSIRLLAYQASLVDEYPPFSFDDAPTSLSATGAMP
jgi:hypothetical protein